MGIVSYYCEVIVACTTAWYLHVSALIFTGNKGIKGCMM